MTRIAMCLLLCACAGSAPELDDDDTGSDTGPDMGSGSAVETRIVAYYASWDRYERNYQVDAIPVGDVDVINYAFLNISAAGECMLGDVEGDAANFTKLQALAQANPGLEVLLSVGGWTWSTRFSDVALTAASREKFAKSCVALMNQYGFDGIDIDWEYPGGGGLAPGRPEDTQNFTLLLAALRAELGTKRLTIAAPADAAKIDKIEVAKIAASLDWVNVMTYDFHGTFETTTNFNAALPDVTKAAETWVAKGLPKAKLVLGMPLYGYGWTGVPAQNNGLLQTATGPGPGTWQAGIYDYGDIAAHYAGTMTHHWSDEAKSPWLYDATRGLMIVYDDVESLTAKAQLVKAAGYGGAMYWELSSDDTSHTLVRTVHDVLVK